MFRQSPRTTERCDAGFTLIEMLVGLALMGMAAALLLSGLRMAGFVSLRERASATGLDEVIAAQRLLRTGLERLRPIARIDRAEPVVEFGGNDVRLTYIAPPADREAPNALQRFLLMRNANGDLVLYNTSTRRLQVDPSGHDLVGWSPTTVLRGISRLSISYRGVPIIGGDRTWLTFWWDRGRPPELIRIRVDFPVGDTRQWPDLLIRPRATTTTTCLIDGSTGRCGEGR